MKQEEAIKLLVQVANLAQERGLFTLKDALVIAQAIDVVDPKEEKLDIGGGILTSPRHKRG